MGNIGPERRRIEALPLNEPAPPRTPAEDEPYIPSRDPAPAK